ncbi:TlpA family protein disulfide reductase [Lysobacter sp. K5869]|uniref:TlpA family protein disulfide reductase n=1 Tax=Lysobacter sp. K5869 TaxID=2820808 RepID=UPI001C064664|nr:TlpA disulfide reductase family protein [Lysobacter sp. K5869]QWP79000.1 TlpA family protein disulfide reductase [Lysobacter sp. K5869]
MFRHFRHASFRRRAASAAARGLRAAFFCAVAAASFAALPAQAETGEDFARQAGSRVLGRALPPLTLTDIDGGRHDLGALRGRKAVYLKFWATWCSPCRAQMPHFQRAFLGRGEDLEVIAVNIGFDDSLEQIRAFQREYRIGMPVVRDDGRLGELFGLRVTPQHVLIGKDGRVAYVGHEADARLDAELARVRRAPAPAEAGAAAPLLAAAAQPGAAPLAAGAAVPALGLQSLEARPLALSDPARRRASVLVFLSPWCESYFAQTRPQSARECRQARESLVAHGRDRRVRWVGIASGLWASPQDLREYRDRHRIPAPLALDRDGEAFRRFGIDRVPAVWLVDAQGRLLRRLAPGEDVAAAALAAAPPHG